MDTEGNGNSVAPNEWGSNTLACGLGLIPSLCRVRVSSSPVIPMDEQTTRWNRSHYRYVCWVFMFIFSWERFGSNKNVRESISVQSTSKPLPVFHCDAVQIKGSMFARGIVLMSKPSFRCSCKHLPKDSWVTNLWKLQSMCALQLCRGVVEPNSCIFRRFCSFQVFLLLQGLNRFSLICCFCLAGGLWVRRCLFPPPSWSLSVHQQTGRGEHTEMGAPRVEMRHAWVSQRQLSRSESLQLLTLRLSSPSRDGEAALPQHGSTWEQRRVAEDL